MEKGMWKQIAIASLQGGYAELGFSGPHADLSSIGRVVILGFSVLR